MEKLGTCLATGIIFLFFITNSGLLIAGDAILTWDPNADAVAGYKVYYGTASRTYGTPIDVGNQTTYTVTGLIPGTFYFAVTAYNSARTESGFSNEVSKTITAADTTPPVISAVTASSITQSGATISWTTNEPSDTRVDYGTTTGYGNSTSPNTNLVTFHSVTLSGLTPSTLYHFRVGSLDAATNLAISGDFTFTTATDATGPSVPANLTARAASSTQINLAWTASTDNVAVKGYKIFRNGTQVATSTLTSFQNTGLTSSTTYSYTVSAYDAANNNSAQSAAASATTQAATDTTPPVISALSTGSITPNGATINWTTNEASDTQVEYGKTTGYGKLTTLITSLETSHSTSLSGLTASTLYHYRVRSRDAAGNLATSTDFTFTTAADTTAPTIASVTASSINLRGATIIWTTNEASDGQVDYGTSTGYGMATAVYPSRLTSHSVPLSGLTPSTLYHYRVKSRDAAGNLATSTDFTFTTAADTAAPTVSSVSASSINPSGATIGWKTDEASDSQVDYGTTTGYGSSTTLNSRLVTTHSVPLAGLNASTLYHYQVKSRDASGNLATSADFTFTTAADTTPPTISSVNSSSITESGANISWATGEASDTQVDYGTTTGYGSSTTLDTSLVTSHSTTLSGLTASTLYHYRVRSRDAAGNLATSADFTLTTLAGNSDCAPASVRCVASTPGPTQEYMAIQAAADAAQPGDTVLVYDGNYAGFVVSSSGTAAAPIHFRAAGSKAVINVDGPTGDSIVLQNVSNISVEGFYMESPGKRCVEAMGATPVAPMQGLLIRNNTCHASGVEGFFLSNVSGGVIELNNIINAGRGNNPGGHGISLSNAGSDDTTLRDNIISGSSGDGMNVSGEAAGGGDGLIQGLLLEDNTISGSRLNGVGLDGVQDAVVQNNLVYANGLSAVRGYQSAGAQGPRNLTVANNTLLVSASGEFAIKLTEDLGGHTLFNNILLSDSAGGGSVAVSNRSRVSGANGGVDRFSLDGGVTLINLAQWQASGYDGGSFITTAADLFVNGAGNDYHLKAASAAIDRGRGSLAAARAPDVDLEGKNRPQGSGYDEGAFEFVVQTADTTPPVISGVTPTSITPSGATINWTTDEPSDSQVEYGTTTSYGMLSSLISGLTTTHSVVLSGLSGGTTYYFRVRSRDASGNLAVFTGSSLTTQVAAQSLTVSNILVTNVASLQATIKWTTNLPSTSQVEYGTSIRLGALSALNPTLITDHAVTLTKLKAGKTFYFRVRSKDSKGNLVVSSVSSFSVVR